MTWLHKNFIGILQLFLCLYLENKNQELNSSLSSPAPEKPPRSQDIPADEKDQADEDEHGETVDGILEIDPANSGKINNATSKQGE